MATQIVTISIVNGNAQASPDNLQVDPGDTVVWQLAQNQNLHWPQPPNPVANAIWHLSGSSLISGLQFVAAVSPSTTRTIQGTVPLSVTQGANESYNISITVQNPANEDVYFLSTHRLETFDPKITVKTHPE